LSIERPLVLAAALALGACTTLGPNFRRPDAPSAQSYAMPGDAIPRGVRLAGDSRAAGPWWKALGSAQLDGVMALALSDNQTLAAADATLERARDEAAAARGALAPQVDATAGAQRERINTQAFGITGFPSPTINLYSIGATVSYDLDLFGGAKRRVESAEAAAQAQARRADAAYLTLTGDVAAQAVRIAGIRAELAALSAVLADDERSIEMVRDAERLGGAAPSAAVGGEAQLAQDKALAPPLQQQLAQSRHALALLVGKSPGEWSAPEFNLGAFSSPPDAPIALPSALVRRRPDILAAEADLHAATAEIGVATADLYPNIRLQAGLTQEALTPLAIFSYNSTAWNVGAGLAAPIFHGGTLRARQRAAQAQARASLAMYKQTVLTAFVQVSDVLTALAHDDARLTALDEAQTAAQSALNDARAAFRLGGGAFLPVVDAQRQLERARLARAEAAAQRLIDLVSLFSATAADWREADASDRRHGGADETAPGR
jgi:NodT family efflux transporter outer membrane factor (OMF) lipoprotein